MQNRESLGFRAEVERAFEYLRDAGFSIVSADHSTVRFESDRVFVEVYHGDHDFEIGLNYGRLDRDERISFGFFLRAFDRERDRSLGERLADSPEAVKATVSAVAHALRHSGARIVRGEDEPFDRLAGVTWWQLESIVESEE